MTLKEFKEEIEEIIKKDPKYADFQLFTLTGKEHSVKNPELNVYKSEKEKMACLVIE